MTRKTTPHYAAFISYAHADELVAARLHKALETYPVPKHLRAEGKTTKPVFRDVAELTAAHSLSEKIQEAVKGSRVLIVLCSPAAKASHWVNEEIRLFRELHGEAAILSAIIEGTPETAFPAALVEGGREPLAAALCTDKAGFKLGVTQLAAGMLGTGLDDLIQRGAKRRNRIMGAGMAASLTLSGVMGFATFQAVEARNEAEAARGDAEGLVEYMIKDLKFKLEPVGRLDLLEGIGGKAVEYYDKQDLKDLNDASLNRQAAARQVLAQVHLDAGRLEEAQREIEASAALTHEVLMRNPNDADAIFAHAQSEFWVGKYYFNQGLFAKVEPHWLEYVRLQQKVYAINPNHYDYIMEAAFSANALGAYYDRRQNYINSKINYDKAENYFRKAMEHSPLNPEPVSELANVLAGQARAVLQFGSYDDVDEIRKAQLKLYEKSVAQSPQDKNLIYEFNLAKFKYYTDVLRFAKSKDLDYLDGVINAFDQLILLEPNKKRWIETTFGAKFIRLDGYYQQQDALAFSKYFQDFERTSNDFFLIEGKSNRYKGFIYNFAKIQFLILNNDIETARQSLAELNSINQPVEATDLDSLEIDARLMIMNFEIGKYEMAENFAKKYLSSLWVNSTELTPAMLEYKLHAYKILQKCSAAKSGASKLKSRNFYPVVSLNQKTCN